MNGRSINSSRFLLDTNLIIAILNKDPTVTRRITPDLDIYIPCIAVGEVVAGAHRSSRVEQNLQAVKSLSKALRVLSCNVGTAEAYGVLHAHLQAKGQPIPSNDIWIAAIAHQRNLTLITRDAHFQHIDFLSILIW
jgi:tRNA(fMet)-specific endonuclease VapC